jgi:phage terminase large subunit GpA-like protein
MPFAPLAKPGASHESVAASRRQMPDSVSRCSVLWRVAGRRAEALNCVVYGLAAHELVRLDCKGTHSNFTGENVLATTWGSLPKRALA